MPAAHTSGDRCRCCALLSWLYKRLQAYPFVYFTCLVLTDFVWVGRGPQWLPMRNTH